MASEKRFHRRFRSTRVQLRVRDRASLHAALRDVSEGGLYIETASPPHVGETSRVELFPPGWPHPLLLSGTVVRAELTGYAVRLDPPSDKAKAQLKSLVAQVANELSGPTVKSMTEAQQRLAEMEGELRDTKERLARVQADAENNRSYLERALAQAGSQRKRGNSNLVVALAAAASFGAGVVLATAITVARTPTPASPDYGAQARPQTVKSLEGTGPKRPHPLPMAAIFPDAPEAQGARDAGAVRDAGAKPALAAKKSPAPAPPAPPAPPAEAGRLNFVANSPAAVVMDGKMVGNTPLKGLALKPGTYQVQFVCGDGTASPPRPIEVLPFSENDVEHSCP